MRKNNNTPASEAHIALATTNDMRSTTAISVYARLQWAIEHDGEAIYNGSQETCVVPFIADVRRIHPMCDPKSPQFDAVFDCWSDSVCIHVLSFDRCASTDRRRLMERFCNAATLDYWDLCCETGYQLNDDTCMAIRVELNDGNWFEYIMNNAKPDADWLNVEMGWRKAIDE